MGKIAKNRHRYSSRQYRPTPYPTPQAMGCTLKRTAPSAGNDWEESTCSVCMEFPHNAVLLLCSSHDNGCRPYMCGTGHRHSNCLEQFKKAYANVSSGQNPRWPPGTNSRASELLCPLCRGEVKGWTVVAPARRYLNGKKRICVEDDCSFVGTYKELKRHAKSEHRSAMPRRIDPEMEEKWRAMELESERRDVLSTVMSATPRSMVFGDYVVEMTDGYDVAGAGEDGAADEDSLVLRRNIMYVLREGARLMRIRWDDDVEESGGFDRSLDVGVVADSSNARSGVGVSSANGRNRRRRRRSRDPSARAPSAFDVS